MFISIILFLLPFLSFCFILLESNKKIATSGKTSRDKFSLISSRSNINNEKSEGRSQNILSSSTKICLQTKLLVSIFILIFYMQTLGLFLVFLLGLSFVYILFIYESKGKEVLASYSGDISISLDKPEKFSNILALFILIFRDNLQKLSLQSFGILFIYSSLFRTALMYMGAHITCILEQWEIDYLDSGTIICWCVFLYIFFTICKKYYSSIIKGIEYCVILIITLPIIFAIWYVLILGLEWLEWLEPGSPLDKGLKYLLIPYAMFMDQFEGFNDYSSDKSNKSNWELYWFKFNFNLNHYALLMNPFEQELFDPNIDISYQENYFNHSGPQFQGSGPGGGGGPNPGGGPWPLVAWDESEHGQSNISNDESRREDNSSSLGNSDWVEESTLISLDPSLKFKIKKGISEIFKGFYKTFSGTGDTVNGKIKVKFLKVIPQSKEYFWIKDSPLKKVLWELQEGKAEIKHIGAYHPPSGKLGILSYIVIDKQYFVLQFLGVNTSNEFIEIKPKPLSEKNISDIRIKYDIKFFSLHSNHHWNSSANGNWSENNEISSLQRNSSLMQNRLENPVRVQNMGVDVFSQGNVNSNYSTSLIPSGHSNHYYNSGQSLSNVNLPSMQNNQNYFNGQDSNNFGLDPVLTGQALPPQTLSTPINPNESYGVGNQNYFNGQDSNNFGLYPVLTGQALAPQTLRTPINPNESYGVVNPNYFNGQDSNNFGLYPVLTGQALAPQTLRTPINPNESYGVGNQNQGVNEFPQVNVNSNRAVIQAGSGNPGSSRFITCPETLPEIRVNLNELQKAFLPNNQGQALYYKNAASPNTYNPYYVGQWHQEFVKVYIIAEGAYLHAQTLSPNPVPYLEGLFVKISECRYKQYNPSEFWHRNRELFFRYSNGLDVRFYTPVNITTPKDYNMLITKTERVD